MTRVEAVGPTTTLAERKRRAGQRLFLGFDGTGISAELAELARFVAPGGFVLFARNVEAPEQVWELNRDLTALLPEDRPPVLMVDQEGGRVQRVEGTAWPTMQDLARAETLTEQVSAAMAAELLALGFHLNLAPVADVDAHPDNPVIGDRSFAERPRDAARHVAAFVRGHRSVGMATCLKHFPGHGRSQADSHVELPTVDASRRLLEAEELVPFRAGIASGTDAVMTAHVHYPALDAAPATLSRTIVDGLLRNKLGFSGVVLSDDLQMLALADHYTLEQRLERALQASVDQLMLCERPEEQVAAFEALVRLQEANPAAEKAMADADARLMNLRLATRRSWERPALQVVGCGEHQALAFEVRVRNA